MCELRMVNEVFCRGFSLTFSRDVNSVDLYKLNNKYVIYGT